MGTFITPLPGVPIKGEAGAAYLDPSLPRSTAGSLNQTYLPALPIVLLSAGLSVLMTTTGKETGMEIRTCIYCLHEILFRPLGSNSHKYSHLSSMIDH